MRRPLEERRRDRAAGVDRYGRPLPRVTGDNPRAAAARDPRTGERRRQPPPPAAAAPARPTGAAPDCAPPPRMRR